MSSKPLNAIDGISVSADDLRVIYANGDVTANNLIVTGLSDLGNIGNVNITGGYSGQIITTDGLGNLSFTTITGLDSAAPMPYYIPRGNIARVPLNYQGLFGQAIDIEGTLEVDGILYDVNDPNPITGISNTQITFVNNGQLTGNNYFTYDIVPRLLNVPNMSVTGNIIPTSNLTYSLGNNTNRFSNIYLENVSVNGNIEGKTNGFTLGYINIPQIQLTSDTTISLPASGKHYYSTSSSNFTLTIANNATANFDVGTTIHIINQGTGNITIAEGTDVVLFVSGNSTSGSRILTGYGTAMLIKVAIDTWFISGNELI